MGAKKAKSAGIPQPQEDAARKKQEVLNRMKHTYWTIRKTDELVIKTNQTIDSARIKLGTRASRRKPPPPKPEREFGELLISGIEHPKRRADD